jgi:hypothetical protein
MHTLHSDEGIVTICKRHHVLSRHWYILQRIDSTRDHRFLVLRKKHRSLTYKVVEEIDAHWVKAELITSIYAKSG